MRAASLASLVVFLVAPASVAAQTPPSTQQPSWLAPTPMTPSQAHERLAFLVGTWTLAGFAPEGDFRDTCNWLGAGRRHLVCHAAWTTSSGPREGLSIFSYRGTDGVYVYQGFRASGSVQVLEGKVSDDGKIFEFQGEEGSGTAYTRTRVTILVHADGSVQFKEQTATGEPGKSEWSPEAVVTYVRVPAR